VFYVDKGHTTKGKNSMKKHLIISLSCLILIAFIILIVIKLPQKSTSINLALSSAIVNLEFPTSKIPYPSDWPEDIQFPEDLILVEANSGTATDGERQGWSGKFRCSCTPNEAEKIIMDDLKGKDWSQVENMRLEAGGVVFIVEKEPGEGIIIIDYDPDDDKQSIILATFFP
jgi:hypothetical protein